ncbi:uncharacterized protein TrAFT101_003442 [Trichoderma asperellum]|uniref:uncharacterized protein n=1 Tax=Trichoderma asperellum TaxID=101201 RepID=UPI00332895F0|nr:hypothetical protein TrAFT101_003442 [Trichoderma asperellum]
MEAGRQKLDRDDDARHAIEAVRLEYRAPSTGTSPAAAHTFMFASSSTSSGSG